MTLVAINRKRKTLYKQFGDRVNLDYKNGCLYLSGEVESWEEVVQAGLLCAVKNGSTHVVNDIKVRNFEPPATKIPRLRDDVLEGKKLDVLIIGAGVTGCAIARELSKWKIDVLLVEKEYDVALHASSRNDGMVHPGIDLKYGQLKRKMNHRGNRIYTKLCSELNVPFERCGQYICFKEKKILPILYLTVLYWLAMGVGRTYIYNKKKLRKMEPNISPDIRCALEYKQAGIVCPYGLTIALAENAVQNGVMLSLDTAVLGIKVSEGCILSVETNRGEVYPKLVINAAGVFAEDIAEMAEDRFFSIHPRRGTNAILDKKAKKNLNSIYSLMGTQSKSAHTKGGAIVSTVDGNVLVGPDAVETPFKENFETAPESIHGTFERQGQSAPWLKESDIITYFTGIRAATYEEDFIIDKGRNTKNIIHAAGIQSPGLTAAPAIAERVSALAIRMLRKSKHVVKNQTFNPIRYAIVRPTELPPAERAALIKSDPNYGEILCRCEEVSRGEIIAAMRRPVPCVTIDGIKRRVRPGMGRCQGGFCSPLIIKLISETLGIPEEEVRKGPEGSEPLLGPKGGRT